MNEKLAELFQNKEFAQKTVECDSSEEVLDLIHAEGIETTKEEFDSFMDMVAQINARQEGELDENELEQVAGGFALTAGVVVPAAVTLLIAGVKAAKWYFYDEPYSRGKQNARASNNKRSNNICVK